MNILVCIKQILAPEAVSEGPGSLGGNVAGNEAPAAKGGARIFFEPSFADDCYRMNPYDEHALEEALRIRERFPEAKIDALAVGPDRCRQVLRRALEMGADRAVLLQVASAPMKELVSPHPLEPATAAGGAGGAGSLSSKELVSSSSEEPGRSSWGEPGWPASEALVSPSSGEPVPPHARSDSKPAHPGDTSPPQDLTPYETAAIIAAYLRDKSHDLIFAGVMAEDGMAGQTGQLLAELLGLPCATAVISERLHSPHGPIHVEREEDGGERSAYEIALPALLTIQSGINRPRYPALSHVLRARAQEIVVVAASGLRPTPRERVVDSRRRESSSQCEFLPGPFPEQARQFLDFCRQRGFLNA